jgi:hypothetical protein
MPKLRGHSPRLLPWDRNNGELSPKQRTQKAKFLHAESLARRNKARLEEALQTEGLPLPQVLRNTDAVKMVHGEVVPKVRDRIPRSMKIYEKGKLVHVEVANSEVASDIGRYWDAIGTLIDTGKSEALRNLPRKRFKDITGRFHILERDPRVILELETRKPKPETFEIYKR